MGHSACKNAKFDLGCHVLHEVSAACDLTCVMFVYVGASASAWGIASSADLCDLCRALLAAGALAQSGPVCWPAIGITATEQTTSLAHKSQANQPGGFACSCLPGRTPWCALPSGLLHNHKQFVTEHMCIPDDHKQ